ncbi:hypothetical protein [Arthrobacter sp. VKM Ac-2550]|uniref:hypothetical protein n=1 Tax=Crystallibacter permensis TaxID=1938888 RepID=UPI0022279E2A|nr:hypothetical protein [Arthrobacter sp. VKM Ac-2550]MCW2131511.1 hypothetical protein [Arthrobacter sp. VKM Ac-2550]
MEKTLPSDVRLARLKVELMNPPAENAPYPRRRDIRSGAADPVPPTGMIPVVPLPTKLSVPAQPALPARKELRTGMIQIVPPADGQPSSETRYVPAPKPETTTADPASRRKPLWIAGGAAVVAGLIAATLLFWL